ncbi:MAG: hypothetical protein ACJ8F2_12865 [Xanthobacteraceae bacterium]|jgi:hypothetical protein
MRDGERDGGAHMGASQKDQAARYMSTAEIYQRRSEISLREAERATDRASQKAWLDLAKVWSNLADEAARGLANQEVPEQDGDVEHAANANDDL